MTGADLEHAARCMGYGCVKYADLRQHRIGDYVFSYDKMLDLKGNTAIYLMYYTLSHTHAHTCTHTHTHAHTRMHTYKMHTYIYKYM